MGLTEYAERGDELVPAPHYHDRLFRLDMGHKVNDQVDLMYLSVLGQEWQVYFIKNTSVSDKDARSQIWDAFYFHGNKHFADKWAKRVIGEEPKTFGFVDYTQMSIGVVTLRPLRAVTHCLAHELSHVLIWTMGERNSEQNAEILTAVLVPVAHQMLELWTRQVLRSVQKREGVPEQEED
jgi:hypothetical protein